MREETKKEIERCLAFMKENEIDHPTPQHLSGLRTLVGSADSHKEDAKKILNLWKEFDSGEDDGSLDLYLHIPYCFQRCHYCCYAGERPEGKEELEKYINDLIKYFRFFSPAFKKRIFDNLHIGGGTPSILSAELIEKMLSALTSYFQIDLEGQRSFEFNPSSFTPEKMKVLRDFNFSKISVGVQSFDRKTLELNNRSDQTTDLVERTVKEAIRLGFEWVNIDLLVGMHGDTEEKMIKSFEKAAALDPHSIYLYSIKPTEFYLEEIHRMGREEYFNEAKMIVESVIEKVISIADKMGYVSAGYGALPSLGYQNTWIFLKKDISLGKFYCFGNEQDNSVLGLGKDSISYIKGRVRYTMSDRLTGDPAGYKFLAKTYNERRSMLSFILNYGSLTAGISRGNFRRVFGKDIMEDFSEPIEKLEDAGLVSLTESDLIFNSDLPEDRFLCMMFFLGNDRLDEIVKNDKFKKTNMKKTSKKKDPVSRKKTDPVDNVTSFDDRLKDVMSGGNATLVEGSVGKKWKTSVSVITDEGKRKVFFDELTKIIESKDEGEDRQPSFIREISLDEIESGDRLSVLAKESDGGIEAVVVRKVIEVIGKKE